MSSCSCAPHIASLHSGSPAPARRRLGIALAASIAVHFWLAGALGGAAPARRADVLHFSSIVASLERAMPAAVPLIVPELAESPRERAEAVRGGSGARPLNANGSLGEALRTPDGVVREAPDSTYYTARQLDHYPVLSVPLDLSYPRRALEGGVEGRALLVLHIDETGVVQEVSVVEAHPAGYFEEDARRSFVAARFTPGQRNGHPVKSRVLVEVSYGERSVR